MKNVIKSAYYYDDDEYERVDRMDDPQEIAIAAIAYNYGISREDAIEEYKTITEDKLKDFVSYYFRRGIPQKLKDNYKKSTDDAAQEVCDAVFSNENIECTVGSNMNNMWWDKYYYTISEDELLRLTGLSDLEELGGCETVSGYGDLEHIAWLVSKDEYAEVLENDGHDIVELVDDGNHQFLAETINDRVYDVTDEIADILVIAKSDAEFDEVGQFCEYFDIGYPEEVVDFDEYLVPRWHGQRAVSYFGYDQLVDMTEEVRDGLNMDCGIAGNGDLYIFK